MSDWAHDWTDDQIERLERRFAEEYAQAAREMREKLSKAYEEQQEAQKSWRERVRKGEATSEEYKDWLRERANDRKFIRGLAQTLADDASRANQLARDYINDELPKVYAENANYAAYGIETNIGYDTHSFDLYDQSTVRRLMGLTEHDQIIHEVIEVGPAIPGLQNMRTVNIDRARDVDWNRRKFTSAITQSILQGESIPNASKRLMRVLNMDRNMAVRAARTAITSAENAGRVDSYKRAERIGISLEQQWMATLDERTRYSHRELDGQHVPVGKKFVAKSTGHEIEFPGDPKAHPSETYNCFVGDTLVCADTEIERSYKHEYSGELVAVKTASGIEFTCTPNHPILTPSGWVAAKLLHDGDDLCIARVGDDRLSGVNPDVHHVQARMETVHDLLALRSRKRVAGLDVNFHGDVPASDVEIVGEEGTLRLNAEASGGEGVAELALEPTDPAGLRPRPSGKGFGRVMASAPRRLGRESVASTLLGCQFAHPHVHGIGTVAPFDPSIAEHPSDHVTGMTDTRGDCFLGLTTEIGVDHIINVKVMHTRGTHVYNLQTSDGYYFVGSEGTDNVIIAHNCRCTLVAWSPEMEAEDANTKRFTRLPEGMTYEEWKGKKQEQQRPAEKRKSVRELEDALSEKERALKAATSTRKPSTAGKKYYEGEIAKCQRRMDEFAHAKDYDIKALESRSMALEDKAYELTKRLNEAKYGSDEYHRLLAKKDKLLGEIRDIDTKLYEKNQYDRWSQRHSNNVEALRKLNANVARDEKAYKEAQESIPRLVRERNAAIRELSEAQPFAPHVRSALGDQYADAMRRMIDEASERHPEIAAAYRMFSSVLKIGDAEQKKGAFYRDATKKIYFNAAEVARGNAYERPYETAFHEFGHLIDNVCQYEGKFLGEENGLGDAIKADWVRYRNEAGKADGVRRDKNGHAIRKLRSEMGGTQDGTYAFANVSDIIEGCTRKSYPLGFGHGASYHKREGATAHEFVAELFDSAMANEDSYRQMKRIFPTATGLVEDLVRGLTS